MTNVEKLKALLSKLTPQEEQQINASLSLSEEATIQASKEAKEKLEACECSEDADEKDIDKDIELSEDKDKDNKKADDYEEDTPKSELSAEEKELKDAKSELSALEKEIVKEAGTQLAAQLLGRIK